MQLPIFINRQFGPGWNHVGLVRPSPFRRDDVVTARQLSSIRNVSAERHASYFFMQICITLNKIRRAKMQVFQLISLALLFAGTTSLHAEAAAQPPGSPVTSLPEAVHYLKSKSHDMIHADRRRMANGITAFPPQAGPGYGAFWLRDYVYMLEGCPELFTRKELLDACRLFVNGMRKDGAGVECVKFDGQVLFKPGWGTMGTNPVADGSQFTVEVAWITYEQTKDVVFIRQIIDKLVKTMKAAPRDPKNGLIYIKPSGWDRCPYGFTDGVHKQGDVLFCSLLYVQACRQLANLLDVVDRHEEAQSWRREAKRLIPVIRRTFWNEKTGLFRAATVKCAQPDIWGSAFAVWLGVADSRQARTIAEYFKNHYAEIVQDGQIRQLPGGMYWEISSAPVGFGDDGGYWATATGWFVYTLDLVDSKLADKTIVDLVHNFQAHGVNEWILGSKKGVPNYMSSITLPLAGAQRMLDRRRASSPTSPKNHGG